MFEPIDARQLRPWMRKHFIAARLLVAAWLVGVLPLLLLGVPALLLIGELRETFREYAQAWADVLSPWVDPASGGPNDGD